MHDSKLIELLRQYPLRKLNKFLDFVRSPYFNGRPVLVKLTEHLMRMAPNFEDRYLLSKEFIFNYLYPETPFNLSELHRRFSELLHLFYRFLSVEAWSEQQGEQQLWALGTLRRTPQAGHYEALQRDCRRSLQSPQMLHRERRYALYRLHRELDSRFIDQGGRQYDPNLQEENDHLDAFYWGEKLKIACDMANRNKVVKADYKVGFIETFLEQLEQSRLKDEPYIRIYSTIWQMRQSEEETHYQKLKHLLTLYGRNFADIEQTDMYGYALNYAIGRINQGQPEYYREAFEHYVTMVENRLIFVADSLPAWDYKNIVTIALRLEEYAWTKDFIENYKIYLPADMRENAYRYNLASYHHAIGQHGEALRTLHDVEFTDATYQIGAKIIQLKSYYALGEGEALRSLANAFGNLLRRHKNLSDYWKKSNLHCVRLAQRIYNLHEKRGRKPSEKWKSELEKLKIQLQETTPLANKPWLEQCLRQAEQG